MERGVFSGIILHQGESKSGESDWPNKVKTIYDDLKKDLDIGDVPFMSGELLYSGPCAGHNTQVKRIPEVIHGYGYVASTQGLRGMQASRVS